MQTYAYNGKGNVSAVTQSDIAAEQGEYDANGVDLISYTASNGVQYTYAYNDQHDVTTESYDGLTTTLTYDAFGNVTQRRTSASGAKDMQSQSTITADGNHTASVTDVNGSTTTYTYDPAKELCYAVTNAKNVTTTYAHNNQNDRPYQTYQNGVAAITYGYGRGMLSTLTRKTFASPGSDTPYWQRYSFPKNDWGQRTAVTVSRSTDGTNWTSRTLASYEYEANNGNLKKLTYANGDSVSYEYDLFDRLTRTVYNDTGNYIEYAYTAEGALAKVTYRTSENTVLASYSFEYDSLGRLIRSRQTEGQSTVQQTEHLYDTANRLSAQNWTIGTQSFSESYAYNDPADGGEDADGSLKQMTTATGDELRYTYDELNRLTSRAVYRADGTGFFETRYAFKSGAASNQTTAQVEFYSVRSGVDGTGDAIITYQYVYDALGNITEIRNGASPDELLVSYQYDDQNQLIKETYADGEYYDYIYDTAGNLREVKKNGESIQSYTYDDTAWIDLLTAFMEQKIAYEGQTYDASNNTVTGTALSGNPVSYYNGTRWNFDWENGRQLITAEKTEGTTNTELSYTYDADGIRTSKTYTVETHEGQHTVTFVADGTTVKTMTVDGGYILQDGDYPTVPDKTGYNGSWQQYTAEIHADVTIQATYTIKTYTVSFMKGTLRVARKTFSHGYVLNDSDYPTAPTGYEWERYTQPICSNIVIHAIETTGSGEKYTVTFWASRQLLKTMTVVDGYVLKNSDYPAVPPRTGYTGSWNKYTGAIHESITITARYTKNGSVAMSVGDETELLTSDIAAEEDLTPVQNSGEADAPAAQAGQTLVSTQTVRHDYITQNGKVVRETVTTDGTVTAVMDFIYDESGAPFALKYSTNGGSSFTTYYYVLNLQGDVVKLITASGATVAEYTYNAWGEVLTATGDLAAINPLRYRGYYYDSETGFYYLQSRYYDPITHRFINADSYESTGQGFIGTNMFAYCNNNPVVLRDSTGNEPIETIDLDGDGEIDCYVYEYYYEDPILIILGWNAITQTRQGKIYIYQSANYLNNPDNIPNDFRPNCDVIAVDEKSESKNPNIQVRNSYLITQKSQMYAIIDVLLEYGTNYRTDWQRTRKSLYIEWREHNRYAIFSESAKHVDFDNNDQGKTSWDFFLKAIQRVFD